MNLIDYIDFQIGDYIRIVGNNVLSEFDKRIYCIYDIKECPIETRALCRCPNNYKIISIRLTLTNGSPWYGTSCHIKIQKYFGPLDNMDIRR